MADNLMVQIRSQKALSDGMIQALLPVVSEMYYPGVPVSEIRYGDLGSFARGTNTDFAPDIDLAFLGAPRDGSRGYKDWTPIGTFELTGNKEGITSLADLEPHDPLLVSFIRRILPLVDVFFSLPVGSTQFSYMRTWTGYPGLVFNVSLPHPLYGGIALDINLVYGSTHFGIEHCRRFDVYFNRVAMDLGPDVAERFVLDIRTLKLAAKKLATDPTGWVDRRKKVPGFVIEALICNRIPPYTLSELARLVCEHQWDPSEELRDKSVGDQNDQIIDAGFSFGGLLHNMAVDNYSLTRGGWETLLRAVQEKAAG